MMAAAPAALTNFGKGRRVAILQPVISDYRVAFYLGLERVLGHHAIDLHLFASRPARETFLRDGMDALPFGHRCGSARLLGGGYWQGLPGRLAGFDLVILQQELRALSNYPVIAGRRLFGRPRRVALWGHGTNFSAETEGRAAGQIRRLLNRQVDHFFAYTELSREKFVERGAPEDRITLVNNAIDVGEVQAVSAGATADWKRHQRLSIGLDAGPVIAFCGRLTEKKNLPFLIDAARLARRRLTGLSLIVIGDGTMRGWAEHVCRREPWLKVLGEAHGAEKARLLCTADALCMPYDLGLSILDGFAAALPVVAARGARHNPEIAYLRDGYNGRLSALSVEGYAAAIVDVLSDPQRRIAMSRAAASTAATYTVDAMVENFSSGILQILQHLG